MPSATIPCPICKNEVNLDDPNMPFCSDRCRLLDLGNWASEKYSVPGSSPNEVEDLEEERDFPGPKS